MSAAIGCWDEAEGRLRTAPAALMGSPEVQTILPHHTPPQDARTVFSRAKPKLAVYTHFVLLGKTNTGWNHRRNTKNL
jgi:hypothetical protein